MGVWMFVTLSHKSYGILIDYFYITWIHTYFRFSKTLCQRELVSFYIVHHLWMIIADTQIPACKGKYLNLIKSYEIIARRLQGKVNPLQRLNINLL